MSRFDQNHVVIKGCTIVWDGVTRPDKNQDGTPKYNLKVVVDPNNPDLLDFQAMAQETLQASKFAGVLPAGGRMPVGVAGPTEFNGMFPGFAVISAKTKFVPNVHAEDVSVLEPMQYAQMLYAGQRVDILIHCYAYDAMGNKGVAAGLDGLQIISSANAPRLEIGQGGVDTAGAFGAAPAAQGFRQDTVAAAQAPYAAPVAQPPYAAVVGQPVPQPMPGYPAPQPAGVPVQPTYAAPVAQQPMAPATSGYAAPVAPVAQPLPGQPGGPPLQPTQAQGFMPPTPGYPQQ